jgi:uncharacterized protein YbjT (DUF2867 family)
VTAVPGDLADIDSVRTALDGVSTLFLVVANATDELSKAMLTLNAAREAKVKGIVYLSVFKGEQYSDVPRFASKVVIERMIETCDLPATILRPCYFMQNDAQQKDALLNHGVYGMPLGSAGLSVVDTRDIGEAAAKELVVRRPKQRALRKMMRGMKDRVLAASITGRLRPGSSQGLFDEKSAASAGKPPMTASDKSMPRSNSLPAWSMT